MLATESKSDFAGFIDGFQARNLASIQKNISLQLSELNTRIDLVRAQLVPKPDYADILLRLQEAENSMQSGAKNVVDRLAEFADHVNQLILLYSNKLESNEPAKKQIKALIAAYTAAALKSQSERLIDAGLSLRKSVSETLK